MKKLLAICLSMVMTMSMSALAAPGAFFSSPSGKPAPTLVSGTSKSEGCTAQLIITPYADRTTLPDTLLALIERAYKEIVGTDDITKLNADFAKLVADKNLDSSKLAVDQLFDIRVTGCDNHEGHVGFDIVLDAEMLSHFEGLLHMNTDGVWELVADAEVTNNGEHLEFSVDSLSPFAIVINTEDVAVEDPGTGDNNAIYLYAGLMAVSALALIVVLVKNKKQRA